MFDYNFEPEHWPVNNREYHDDLTCDSSSTLKDFLEDRTAYSRVRILGQPRVREYSLEKELGAALHDKLFPRYPHEYDEYILCVPGGSHRSQAFLKVDNAHPDKIVMPLDEAARVDLMCESVLRNSDAMELLSGDVRHEHAVRWSDLETGINLKVMFDTLRNDNRRIADLKSIRPKKPFADALYELGYYRQAALYGMARDMYVGYEPTSPDDTGISYVVVQNAPPFYCYVHHLGAPTLELGQRHLRQILTSLSMHRELFPDSEWPDPGRSYPTVVNVKPWALNKELSL